ncbi:hypothetical protein [Shewanella pealeana]|uniref:DUF3108 domain-containing protein n=1 Tax=Shewanella pealeana (strain ATCC 700345 / ANG-SQ1) TaxID=398579 RepID=A8H8T9_SHEPA|nr:hypothetical protein [Shewanella pealeana]ABV88976.1 conserved hypothetical protein [Shewanella pealeana ATCC 700345]
MSKFAMRMIGLISALFVANHALATEANSQELTQLAQQELAQQELAQQQQCSRSADYDIYLSGIHTGTMSRTETWRGKTAVVTSTSKASILGIGTQYQQRAELSWSNVSNEWITEQFHQKVTGFRARDMRASFSDNGRVSEVDVDGDIETYRSDSIALRDVDTLAIQMRELLLQGRQQFRLIRQASDAIEPYQYYVQTPISKNIAPWGELTLIPVEQSGAEEVTYYFAPEMDYQLIQARYHGIILRGLIELNHYSSTCR